MQQLIEITAGPGSTGSGQDEQLAACWISHASASVVPMVVDPVSPSTSLTLGSSTPQSVAPQEKKPTEPTQAKQASKASKQQGHTTSFTQGRFSCQSSPQRSFAIAVPIVHLTLAPHSTPPILILIHFDCSRQEKREGFVREYQPQVHIRKKEPLRSRPTPPLAIQAISSIPGIQAAFLCFFRTHSTPS